MHSMKKEGEMSNLSPLSKSLTEKSKKMALKEKELFEKTHKLLLEEKKIKQLIIDLKDVKVQLLKEMHVKKELMKSFLGQWEKNFHQLQFVKQQMQGLIYETQELIHADLQELYSKEQELRPPKIKIHTHSSAGDYDKHVKKLKKELEKQVSIVKKTKNTPEKFSLNALVKHVESLISSGDISNAKIQLKKVEQELKKVKDVNQKKVLNYEIQDLKTSIKLAEIAL